MRRLLYTQIPAWARPDHATMRYLLRRNTAHPRTLRYWLLRLLVLTITITLLLGGARYYEQYAPAQASSLSVLLFPLLLFTQFIATTGALIVAANALSTDQHREAWDLVRTTSHGAELVMRSRWASVFYDLRWVLLVLMLPRLFLVGRMIVDLRQYNGYYLDLYISGITPEVSVEVAVLLLAAFLTAAVLQPFVTVGLSAAAGLMISTFSSRRYTVLTIMLFIVLAEVIIFALALWLGFSVITGDPNSTSYASMSMHERLSSVFFMAIMGDQSLSLLDMETYFQVWADVDYGILIGGALLVVVLIEAALTMGLLAWSARRAAHAAHE